MTLTSLALTAAVVVILGLVGLVLRLQRRVGRLCDEVHRTPAPAEPPPTHGRPDGPVALITGLRVDGSVEPAAELTRARVVSVTFAGPMIKVAAFSHGLRRALEDEHRMRVAYAFRRELRRQRKMRRKASTSGPRQHAGWLP